MFSRWTFRFCLPSKTLFIRKFFSARSPDIPFIIYLQKQQAISFRHIYFSRNNKNSSRCLHSICCLMQPRWVLPHNLFLIFFLFLLILLSFFKIMIYKTDIKLLYPLRKIFSFDFVEQFLHFISDKLLLSSCSLMCDPHNVFFVAVSGIRIYSCNNLFFSK